MKKLLFPAFLILLAIQVKSQTVEDIRFQKTGTKVYIHYDLKGPHFSKWSVSVRMTKDGTFNWVGPLKNVTGEIGDGIKPGKDKLVIWDMGTEKLNPGIPLTFMLDAVPYKGADVYRPYTPAYYKYRRSKEISLASALLFTAGGFYLKKQAGDYYSRYKTATSDAPDLHKKVALYDNLAPVAFGIGGLCAFNFILKSFQQHKAKNARFAVAPFTLKNSNGILLSYEF